MKHTSIESYRKISPSKLQSECGLILDFLGRWSPQRYSNRDIARATGLNITVVWSRTTALSKRGLIVAAGEMHDSETDRKVQTWRIKVNT
jgi:hypothetical protein